MNIFVLCNNFNVYLTFCGLASVGDLVSQMYKLKTELASTKPTLINPKTPIAPNRCCTFVVFLVTLVKFSFFFYLRQNFLIMLENIIINRHYNGFGHLAKWKVGFVFGRIGKTEKINY